MKAMMVTRHAALVAYAREIGLIDSETTVVSHVNDPEQVAGHWIIGVLPLHLAAMCRQVTEIPLALTQQDREVVQKNHDLSLSRVRAIAGQPVTYQVRHAPDVCQQCQMEFGQRGVWYQHCGEH